MYKKIFLFLAFFIPLTNLTAGFLDTKVDAGVTIREILEAFNKRLPGHNKLDLKKAEQMRAARFLTGLDTHIKKCPRELVTDAERTFAEIKKALCPTPPSRRKSGKQTCCMSPINLEPIHEESIFQPKTPPLSWEKIFSQMREEKPTLSKEDLKKIVNTNLIRYSKPDIFLTYADIIYWVKQKLNKGVDIKQHQYHESLLLELLDIIKNFLDTATPEIKRSEDFKTTSVIYIFLTKNGYCDYWELGMVQIAVDKMCAFVNLPGEIEPLIAVTGK